MRPIGLSLALVVTFVVLLTLGTQRPDQQEPAAAAGASGPTADTAAHPPDWMRRLNPGEKPPQFVLFSFDGAGSHEHWQKMLRISHDIGGARFSAFLSGIYLLTDDQKSQYIGPGHPAGKASISFGGSAEEVKTRIDDLNTAKDRGIEIGTHYNGHFCAGAEPSVGHWNAQQWRLELDQFVKFMAQAPGLKVDPASVKGGRTPCLEGQFNALFDALTSRNMTYDSSKVADGVAWPTKDNGIWEFWMPQVRVPAVGNKKVVMMDYNLWYAFNRVKDDKSRRDEFARNTLDVYRAAYNAAFQGNRAPLVIANHFNDWAGGGFTDATEAYFAEVCTKPQTVCATYTEVIQWMDLQTPATLEALRKLPNAQT
ncbi:hypothetical protein EV192_105552 [Actinocrispum wychmicini]|uniref:Polysaccharide deacetylase n=1 Tax=Actinocrispum wychmicini TaxID=1213861 RepID=A0A4R2JJ37_9PSEU|nr:hypothetical protein EV192_105552 [Actinocrispum wychmicini]